MKKLLPAALLLTLAACGKKDAKDAPPPGEPVWKLTEIAGERASTFFYYNPAGEPSAWVSRSPAATDSTEVAWAGGKPAFTYLFFNQQKRIDRSFVFAGNLLTRIQYYNFDHSGRWTVTDYDSLVYGGSHLAELHVVNGGARNQLFKLYWEGNNVARSESFDIIAESPVLTGTTKYIYNSQPALARVFQPWCYFIWSDNDFTALSHNELAVEERASASGALRWRNTYGHAYLSNGRLERTTRRREDFIVPATENSARQFVYRLMPNGN